MAGASNVESALQRIELNNNSGASTKQSEAGRRHSAHCVRSNGEGVIPVQDSGECDCDDCMIGRDESLVLKPRRPMSMTFSTIEYFLSVRLIIQVVDPLEHLPVMLFFPCV
ncbi:hypothetical protein CAPTEDRAFT_210486 [Capitella teleta]|uniref:Uncharacterized protein n=1 Tax=Capitella teleta TaxID=283909 RepID=R7VF20_CAPTE|nr:hypothetical protein CAPTEDRAFT_210486 [Capitella teleta]|eukprot:ELU17199.1 hypothetical protein CAPTEDRAFT_210486 [Capitella teleta]